MSDKVVAVGLRIDGDASGAHRAATQTAEDLTAVDRAAHTAQASSSQLNKAFATLGVRSAKQIEADILEINQALQRLAQRADLSGAEFDRAFGAAQERLKSLHAELNGLPVEPLKNSVGGLTGSFSGLNGVLGALGVGSVADQFLKANLAADKLKKSLNAVNGDATKTAADLEFLRGVAERLGINLDSSSAGFVKLAAAAKGTSLEGQATRDIFENLASGMSQLGMSSQETENAFVAVAQMMSKGTIAAEELKGQLGDAMPGAMQVMARATGLSIAELNKLMESGGLLAEDVLPKFAVEVRRSFGDASGHVEGLSNSIERIKNTWSQALKILGDAGALQALAGAAAALNEVFLWLATGVTAVVAGLVAFAKTTATVMAAMASLDFSNLGDSLREIGDEAASSVEKMARLTGVSKLVGEAINGVAEETNRGAAAVDNGTVSWDKLRVVYDESVKSMTAVVDQTKRINKATEEQSELLIKLAQLSGDENELLRAKELAAQRSAESSARLAEAIEREAQALRAKQSALESSNQTEIEAGRRVSAEKIKAVEEAKAAADAKLEEARAARSNADASGVAAAAQRAESAARADNSARVAELKDVYDQATARVDALKAAQASGIDVEVELKQAQLDAASAANLYKDALHDQTAKIASNLSLKQAQIGVDMAGIRLAIEQQRSILEVARARGDEVGAMQAAMEMKRLEIKLAELTAKSKAAEAKAALMTVDAKWKELEASGQLTDVKRAELEAQRLAAEAKKVEADIAKEVASRMREVADASLNAGVAAGGSRGGFDNLADGMNRAADAADRLKNAQGATGDSGGSSSASSGSGSGARSSIGVSSRDMLYRAGASIEEAKAAEKYYGELFNRSMLAGSDSVRTTEDNNRLIQLSSKNAVEEALRLARQELATGKAADLGESANDLMQRNLALLKNRGNFGGQSDIALSAIKSAMADAGREAQAQTIRLEIGAGEKKSTVYASSHQDAMEFLRTLESAGLRAAK